MKLQIVSAGVLPLRRRLTLPITDPKAFPCLTAFITVFLRFPWAVSDRSERMLRVAEYLGEEVSGLAHGDNRLRCNFRAPGGHRPRGDWSRPALKSSLGQPHSRSVQTNVNNSFLNCHFVPASPACRTFNLPAAPGPAPHRPGWARSKFRAAGWRWRPGSWRPRPTP